MTEVLEASYRGARELTRPEREAKINALAFDMDGHTATGWLGAKEPFVPYDQHAYEADVARNLQATLNLRAVAPRTTPAAIGSQIAGEWDAVEQVKQATWAGMEAGNRRRAALRAARIERR